MDRAPTPGLLSDLNVLIFPLLTLPFNREYAKKAHHMYSMFLTSFHCHLDSTWQKIGSLIWFSRVRCICFSISSSPFSLAPLMKFQSFVRSFCYLCLQCSFYVYEERFLYNKSEFCDNVSHYKKIFRLNLFKNFLLQRRQTEVYPYILLIPLSSSCK